MRMIAMLVVLLACFQSSCRRTPAPTVSDLQWLQGEWQLVSGERHGQAFPDEILKQVRLTFAGNVLKTTKPDSVTEATVTLHPELDPKGIDIDMDGSPGLGIYKLEDNTLTILHGEIEEPRPKNFEAVKSGTLTLLVLRKTG
jgi:uncharacterized protein (TIGR03067 family)